MIPSPEPGAAQGTSSIILALGVLFFPMGLMKGGFPSFRRAPGQVPAGLAPGPKVNPPVPMTSGRIFALGVLVLVLGADAVLIPGILVLKSLDITGMGAFLTALGALLVYFGSRKPREP
jgi:hypothetical protein